MTSKKDSMYIKACVIANGLQDKQNDIISKKDIKRVFTNSLDVGFDINHDNIRKEGIYSIENYISKSDEDLNGTIVPSGSWMTVLRIDNPEVQDMIQKGDITGVSIIAYPEKGAVTSRHSNDRVLYKDIKEKDKIHPKEISLVKNPANGLPLQVMTYDNYISKSMNNWSDKMTEDSTLNKLIDVLSSLRKGDKQNPVSETSTLIEKEEDDTEVSLEELEPDKTPLKDQEDMGETGEKEEEIEKTEDDNEVINTDTPGEVSKSMIPPQQDPQQQMGGGAEQALVQIAQICAKFLQATQHTQMQPQQNQIMQSTDADPETLISKSSEESKEDTSGSDGSGEKLEKSGKVTEKVTKKFDDPIQVTESVNSMEELFCKQTGRDPYTFEKIN